jgi:ABC-2 type transport system ATP-binding protein
VLVVESLGKDYGDFVALEDVNLEVQAGSLVALVGPNGAGKSTLLRCCTGLLEPTAGTVLIGGVEPGSVAARAATSFLPDEPVLYDDLSVLEHLEYVARLHGHDDWEPRAEDLLTRLGILHRAEDLPSRFSRGLRQKTSIAVGLVRPFDLLLVDEPFVGLDAPGKIALVELMKEAAEKGAAVVVSTHELTFVEIADRCIALRDGSVIADRAMTTNEVRDLVS